MIAVITGDIVNSRTQNNIIWLDKLKASLRLYGTEPKDWEIFRGDSFQLQTEIDKAVLASIYIKSCIKQIKGLDTRIAIGIGTQQFDAEKVTQKNGNAFHNSGDCFENLRKSKWRFKSNFPEIDKEINCYFSLALLTINRWSPNTGKIVQTALDNPNSTQTELAQLLKKSQSTINEALSRAGFDEIMGLNNRYKELMQKL